jgi:Flp pilus assembly protein TadG
VSGHRCRASGEAPRANGQSLVEFTLILPVFLLILFGMIEFGFVFTHDLTVEYATREGARAGSALDNGGGRSAAGCGSRPNWTTVDPLVIAAVERVLQSPGSQVVISNVSQIVIYKANPTTGANDQGLQDVWTYSPGAGPIPQGPRTTSTSSIRRTRTTLTRGRPARAAMRCRRIDSIGVSLTYTYAFQTPLASVMRFFGGAGSATLTLTTRPSCS